MRLLEIDRPPTPRARPRPWGRLVSTAAAASVLLGCVGSVTEPTRGDDGPLDRALESCDPSAARPSSSPLRRLTAREIEASAADVLRGVALPAVALPADARVDGFRNNATGQNTALLTVESFGTAAERYAEAAMADPSAFMTCSPSAGVSCGLETTHTLAERAFRRPLRDDDRVALDALFMDAHASYGFEPAMRMVIEALLQSPEFLYRPEEGDPTRDAPDGLIALSMHELATRLSYFVWQAPPDAELLRAASAGELADPEQLRTQAMRMLADPRARAAFRDLYYQWFEVEKLERLSLNAEAFPELTPALRAALVESTGRYFEHAFFEDGTFEGLFMDRTAFANDALAPVFGVAPPGTDELVEVSLPPEERAGLLTQPGLLASTSHGTSHSPVLRGVMLLRAALCNPTGAPPPEVSLSVPESEEPVTTRDRFESAIDNPSCGACHRRINGLGFSFEHYDALGRYQTTENGVAVDSTGQLLDTFDIDGPVADANELSARLASSAQVRSCVATHYLRYALGRTEADRADGCEIYQARAALEGAGGDLHAMVAAIVTSTSFRYRTAYEASGVAP